MSKPGVRQIYGQNVNPIIPWEERSTRNCIHCKVTRLNGTLMVYCAMHVPMETTYQQVMRYRSLRRECVGCSYFEHDVPTDN